MLPGIGQRRFGHGFSPFVVGFAETKTSQGGNTGDNGGNTGTTSGGGTSYGDDNNDNYTAPTYRNHEEDLWKQVEKTIRETKSDNKIIARARNYDRMPAYVMVALRERGHIMLEIHWNGGDTIIIPAGKALNEPNRIFYPLSYLEDYDFADVQVSLKHVDLNTGGEPLDVEAPAIVGTITTPDGKPEITDPRRGLADTIEDAKKDSEKDIPGVFEPETVAPAPDDATESQSKSGGLFAGIALLLAALVVGGGYLYFRKRKEAE